MAILVPVVVRESTATADDPLMTALTMTDESNCGPSYPDGTETDTEQYAEFLDDAPRWLHYERARIDELTKPEVNKLARLELGRRDHGGPIKDDPRRIWAWLFVSYVLRGVDRVDESEGESDD